MDGNNRYKVLGYACQRRFLNEIFKRYKNLKIKWSKLETIRRKSMRIRKLVNREPKKRKKDEIRIWTRTKSIHYMFVLWENMFRTCTKHVMGSNGTRAREKVQEERKKPMFWAKRQEQTLKRPDLIAVPFKMPNVHKKMKSPTNWQSGKTVSNWKG